MRLRFVMGRSSIRIFSVGASLDHAPSRNNARARETPVRRSALPVVGGSSEKLDKGESGPFPGAVYELRVIHAWLSLGWRARCTILELESSNEQRTNRAEEL